MDQTIIQDLHNKKGLPMELIFVILRYTWMQQPPHLLEDIKDYYGSLQEITDQYYNYWNQIEPCEELNWLENDIIRYVNRNRLTILDPPDVKMIEVLSRSIMHSKLIGLPIYRHQLSVKTVINIFWGLLTIAERREFIENRGS